jgi:hypothetical protein
MTPDRGKAARGARSPDAPSQRNASDRWGQQAPRATPCRRTRPTPASKAGGRSGVKILTPAAANNATSVKIEIVIQVRTVTLAL